MMDAYTEKTNEKGETRVILKLKPEMAPIKVAVLPLKKNNDDIVTLARGIKHDLQATGTMRTVYDDTAAIGKLYRRQDEVGTPYCLTVDVKTVGDAATGEAGDQCVTIRERDSMEQIRVPIARLAEVFDRLLGETAWAEVTGEFPLVTA